MRSGGNSWMDHTPGRGHYGSVRDGYDDARSGKRASRDSSGASSDTPKIAEGFQYLMNQPNFFSNDVNQNMPPFNTRVSKDSGGECSSVDTSFGDVPGTSKSTGSNYKRSLGSPHISETDHDAFGMPTADDDRNSFKGVPNGQVSFKYEVMAMGNFFAAFMTGKVPRLRIRKWINECIFLVQEQYNTAFIAERKNGKSRVINIHHIKLEFNQDHPSLILMQASEKAYVHFFNEILPAVPHVTINIKPGHVFAVSNGGDRKQQIYSGPINYLSKGSNSTASSYSDDGIYDRNWIGGEENERMDAMRFAATKFGSVKTRPEGQSSGAASGLNGRPNHRRKSPTNMEQNPQKQGAPDWETTSTIGQNAPIAAPPTSYLGKSPPGLTRNRHQSSMFWNEKDAVISKTPQAPASVNREKSGHLTEQDVLSLLTPPQIEQLTKDPNVMGLIQQLLQLELAAGAHNYGKRKPVQAPQPVKSHRPLEQHVEPVQHVGNNNEDENPFELFGQCFNNVFSGNPRGHGHQAPIQRPRYDQVKVQHYSKQTQPPQWNW